MRIFALKNKKLEYIPSLKQVKLYILFSILMRPFVLVLSYFLIIIYIVPMARDCVCQYILCYRDFVPTGSIDYLILLKSTQLYTFFANNYLSQ